MAMDLDDGGVDHGVFHVRIVGHGVEQSAFAQSRKRENESVHSKLESQSSTDENPKSQRGGLSQKQNCPNPGGESGTCSKLPGAGPPPSARPPLGGAGVQRGPPTRGGGGGGLKKIPKGRGGKRGAPPPTGGGCPFL